MAEVGGGVQQVASDQVVGVFTELVRGQHPHQVLDRLRAEEQQQDPADDLQDPVEALEYQADLERLVQRRGERLGFLSGRGIAYRVLLWLRVRRCRRPVAGMVGLGQGWSRAR